MSYLVREVRPGDEQVLFALIVELARFERLEHAVTGSAAELGRHLFGAEPVAWAVLAEKQGRAVGFALFFRSYSTFLTRPGWYLEDLFVLESERRQGIGKALLQEVIRIARETHAGRLEWAVLDWNRNAIALYESLGAQVLPDWRICRLTLETQGEPRASISLR